MAPLKDMDLDAKKIEDTYEDAIPGERTIFDPPEPYCAPGFKGVFASYYVALCALFSALGGLLFGYDQGVVSVILVMPQFLEQFPEVANGGGFYKGLMTAMIELGALIGALNQGWIADKISRKYSIVLASIIFIIGGVLQTAAVNYGMLTFARFFGGLGVGMLSMVAPLYIAEISPPEIRGTLLVLEEFSIITGIIIAFWTTYGTLYIPNEWSWRLPFLLQIIPAFVLGIGIIFLPFSPRWLASKDRDGDALIALSKLRQLPADDHRIQREWFDIRTEVAMHNEISAEKHPHLQERTAMNRIKLEIVGWTDLFKPKCWRRTMVGSGLMFFQQFVGINALIYYSPTLFETMGLEYNMQLIMSGVLNCVQLVGCATSLYTMDRAGRRALLLWGSLVMFLSHLIISVLVGMYSHDWPSYRPEGWASVALLLVYMLAFGASWGPVPWAMPSEIFSSSSRAKGVALSTCTNWLCNFIIGLITPPLIDGTGYGAYVFFAVFCLLSLFWVYWFVPETAGKSLEDMDRVFKDNSSVGEEQRRDRIEHAIAAGMAGR